MNEIVKVGSADLYDRAGLAGRVITSYDASTPEGRRALYRSRLSPNLKATDAEGRVWPTEHVTILPVHLVRESDGEVVEAYMTVLVSPDGHRLSAVSDGVINSLIALVESFGPPPWRPALLLGLRHSKSRAGRTFYELDLLDDETPKKGGRKNGASAD